MNKRKNINHLFYLLTLSQPNQWILFECLSILSLFNYHHQQRNTLSYCVHPFYLVIMIILSQLRSGEEVFFDFHDSFSFQDSSYTDLYISDYPSKDRYQSKFPKYYLCPSLLIHILLYRVLYNIQYYQNYNCNQQINIPIILYVLIKSDRLHKHGTELGG